MNSGTLPGMLGCQGNAIRKYVIFYRTESNPSRSADTLYFEHGSRENKDDCHWINIRHSWCQARIDFLGPARTFGRLEFPGLGFTTPCPQAMDILKQGYPDIDESKLEQVLEEADRDVLEALDVLRISFGDPGMERNLPVNARHNESPTLLPTIQKGSIQLIPRKPVQEVSPLKNQLI